MITDWIKPPKGTTHLYWTENSYKWLIKGTSAWLDYQGLCFGYFADLSDCQVNSRVFLLPKATEPWTGEGLPPVGTVCEHQPYKDQEGWRKVEIIAHKNTGLPVAVFWDEVGQRATYSSHEAFRPVRTPKQIAVEEREAALEEMTHRNDHAALKDWAAYVYDQLGYRKQVKP
jgi:hypothetical protein